MIEEEIKGQHNSLDIPVPDDEFDNLVIKCAWDSQLPIFNTSKSLAFSKNRRYEKLSDGSVPSPFVQNYWDSSISSSGSGNVIIEENCKCPEIMVVDDNAFNMQVANELVTFVTNQEPDNAFSGDEAIEKVQKRFL